jgi:hypothetical protein
MSDPQNILLIRLKSIGDVVLTLPAGHDDRRHTVIGRCAAATPIQAGAPVVIGPAAVPGVGCRFCRTLSYAHRLAVQYIPAIPPAGHGRNRVGTSFLSTGNLTAHIQSLTDFDRIVHVER